MIGHFEYSRYQAYYIYIRVNILNSILHLKIQCQYGELDKTLSSPVIYTIWFKKLC